MRWPATYSLALTRRPGRVVDSEPGCLLAQPDLRGGGAVDRDRRRVVRVARRGGLAGAGGVGQVARPRLAAQGRPVGRRHRDLHVEHAVAREQRGAEVDRGVGSVEPRVDPAVGLRAAAVVAARGEGEREHQQAEPKPSSDMRDHRPS
jgi:hypothetical protein